MTIDLMHDHDQVLAECKGLLKRLRAGGQLAQLNRSMAAQDAAAWCTLDPVHVTLAALTCLGMIVAAQALAADNPGAPEGDDGDG